MSLAEDVAQTVALIDVLWLSSDASAAVCAFEVEKSTSIYSGILRLIDLAHSMDGQASNSFLVAPDSREREIQAQLHRPAFADLGKLTLRYIRFSELCEHCAGLCKFGEDHRALLKIPKGREG